LAVLRQLLPCHWEASESLVVESACEHVGWSAGRTSICLRGDDGSSKGLPPEQVPDEPGDCVVFETVRSFKGLEREVVILVEVPEAAVRLDELLYVGLTRATTQLVVIAPLSSRRRASPRGCVRRGPTR